MQRKDVVREAVLHYLHRDAQNWMKAKLLHRSHLAIVQGARARLQRLLNQEPFRPQDAGDLSHMRIFSCVVGEPDQPTYFAVLNHLGDVLDHVSLHHIKANASARTQTGKITQADQ